LSGLLDFIDLGQINRSVDFVVTSKAVTRATFALADSESRAEKI
jgi:hypothetical protein